MARACQIRSELGGELIVVGIAESGRRMAVIPTHDSIATGILSKLPYATKNKLLQLQVDDVFCSTPQQRCG